MKINENRTYGAIISEFLRKFAEDKNKTAIDTYRLIADGQDKGFEPAQQLLR